MRKPLLPRMTRRRMVKAIALLKRKQPLRPLQVRAVLLRAQRFVLFGALSSTPSAARHVSGVSASQQLTVHVSNLIS